MIFSFIIFLLLFMLIALASFFLGKDIRDDYLIARLQIIHAMGWYAVAGASIVSVAGR